MRPYRAYINQPSKHQPLHKLHGKFCIAVPNTLNGNILDSELVIDIYFTEGPIHSMRVLKRCISPILLSDAYQ